MKTPPPDPGVYESVPFVVYAAWDAVNIGALRAMAASPLACRDALDSPAKATPAMGKGAVLHACMLEPSRIDTDFVPPPGRMVRNQWKEYTRSAKSWRKYEAANPGKLILADADREAVRAMLDKIRRHKYACGALFDPARKTEVSVVWRDEATGVACKSRPDVVLPGALPDLKTTEISPVSERWLGRYADNLGWYHRASWYERGWRIATKADLPVWFILAQSVPPWDMVVCRPNERARAGAARQIDGWLARYAQCAASGEWPGMAPEPVEFGVAWLEALGSTLEGIDDMEVYL